MKKTSFVLYTSFYSPISKLTREQKGDLLDAIFLHAMDEGVPEMDVATQIAFDFMRHQMDADKDKWNETCRKRSEAGKLGGAPKGNTNARKQAKTSKNKQKQAKQAEYEYEYEYEYEDDNNNADAEKQPKQPIACFKDELKADEVMLAAISSATAIQKDKLIELIPAFENELAINGKKHKNYTEYRLHFKNYASKKAEIERQQQTKSQSNGEFRTSAERRRGKTYDLSQVKPEDYHESF